MSQRFYTMHDMDDEGGYHTHAMRYSPHILIIPDDQGQRIPPFEVDVLEYSTGKGC